MGAMTSSVSTAVEEIIAGRVMGDAVGTAMEITSGSRAIGRTACEAVEEVSDHACALGVTVGGTVGVATAIFHS